MAASAVRVTANCKEGERGPEYGHFFGPHPKGRRKRGEPPKNRTKPFTISILCLTTNILWMYLRKRSRTLGAVCIWGPLQTNAVLEAGK